MTNKELTPEELQIIEAMNRKIEDLQKEDFAIDMCRGKGVTLDKMTEIGDRQREIEGELKQLKSGIKKIKSDDQ